MTRLSRAGCALLLVLTIGCNQWSSLDPSRDFLRHSWDAYQHIYIRADGSVGDPDRNGGGTTSEGQGYAMLRAVWMRDKEAFDRTFRWTEQHLKRADGLYSWLWTPAAGGKILDANTASDADQEIALALILGSKVFQDPQMLARARQILVAIRQHERVDIGHGWFPAAGNWAVSQRIVNLSYFVPYAYPYFARIDPDGRWTTVTESGYDLISKRLGMGDARLIPDFMAVTRDGNPGALPPDTGLSGDFSSDAMRIYWRVAVDCQLHSRAQVCADPLGAGHLTTMLARDGVLFTRYGIDGTPLERVESSSFYGAALPFLLLHAPTAGRAVRNTHLSKAKLDLIVAGQSRYFDANWVWFGLAAADGWIENNTPAVASIPSAP
ncbi:MAG: glycosyl hydrolase family 8 [Vicinamibacterales bacterium]